jgi:hypothetical protein
LCNKPSNYTFYQTENSKDKCFANKKIIMAAPDPQDQKILENFRSKPCNEELGTYVHEKDEKVGADWRGILELQKSTDHLSKAKYQNLTDYLTVIEILSVESNGNSQLSSLYVENVNSTLFKPPRYFTRVSDANDCSYALHSMTGIPIYVTRN